MARRGWLCRFGGRNVNLRPIEITVVPPANAGGSDQGGGREWLLRRGDGSVKPRLAAFAFIANAVVWDKFARHASMPNEMPRPCPMPQLSKAHSLWK